MGDRDARKSEYGSLLHLQPATHLSAGRFYVVLLWCLYGLLSSLMWNMYSPIAGPLAKKVRDDRTTESRSGTLALLLPARLSAPPTC